MNVMSTLVKHLELAFLLPVIGGVIQPINNIIAVKHILLPDI